MNNSKQTSGEQQKNPSTGEWNEAKPLVCPSWLAVQWETFIDFWKGILR